jgi:hypothetical protein
VRLATEMNVECFGDRVGDMRLYPQRGTSAESGPHFFRTPLVTAVVEP